MSSHGLGLETDDWDVYDCELDHQPVSILVNLSAILRAPAPDKPWLLRIAAQPRAARVATSNEVQQLAELRVLRKVVATVLKEGSPVDLVGCVKSHARLELYYYANSTKGFEQIVENVRSRLLGHSIESRSARDPQWTQYREILYPSEVEMIQQIRNRRVLQQLDRNGDDHAVSRPVDHDIYFRTASDSANFVRAAGELGFQARSGPLEQMQGKCERPFFVNMVRSDPVTSDHIASVVAQLILLAARFDGKYDGWGCGVRTAGLEMLGHRRT